MFPFLSYCTHPALIEDGFLVREETGDARSKSEAKRS